MVFVQLLVMVVIKQCSQEDWYCFFPSVWRQWI